MIAPREQFRQTPDYMKRWADIVDSPIFREAVMATQYEFAMNRGNAPDMATAAAMHWQMEGVKKFLGILMTLADPAAKPSTRGEPNLNHRV